MSLELIAPPSKELLENVRSEFGLNELRVKQAVEHLRDWLQLQPHLPKEIDDGRLERWLIRCKNSTEKVKQTLDLYYTLRTKVPEIMTGWDTKGEWFKVATDILFFISMPQLTTNFEGVIIYGFLTPDATNFDAVQGTKLLQMVQEIRISEDYCRSDIIIMDLANYTLAHVPKTNFSDVKKFEMCALSGYNTRVKAVHILNGGPWAEALIAMMKLVFKSKITERIQVHGSDLTSFYAEVPKEILPNEYGGKSRSIAENWGGWKKKLQGYHDIFLEREQHKSDESKRSGPPTDKNNLLGFEGSFRKLDID